MEIMVSAKPMYHDLSTCNYDFTQRLEENAASPHTDGEIGVYFVVTTTDIIH